MIDKTVLGLTLVLGALSVVGAGSRVRIGVDGGYSDILIKVAKNTDQKYCRRIISNLQVKI